MSELIDRQALENWLRTECYGTDTYDDKEYVIGRLREELPTIAAPRWHRVEEPPKEEGRYWCAVWFDGHWIFDAAWYTHDISTVIDVPCCEGVGGFYKGNTEVHPDYWMPIEPPKEDA